MFLVIEKIVCMLCMYFSLRNCIALYLEIRKMAKILHCNFIILPWIMLNKLYTKVLLDIQAGCVCIFEHLNNQRKVQFFVEFDSFRNVSLLAWLKVGMWGMAGALIFESFVGLLKELFCCDSVKRNGAVHSGVFLYCIRSRRWVLIQDKLWNSWEFQTKVNIPRRHKKGLCVPFQYFSFASCSELVFHVEWSTLTETKLCGSQMWEES